MAADDGAYITADSNGCPTIWYQLQLTRNAAAGGCEDWFIPSKDEMDRVRTLGIIPFGGEYIWSSSEYDSHGAWHWLGGNWGGLYKDNYKSVFFVRAF